jgi:release factor glutamine methyltransferase
VTTVTADLAPGAAVADARRQLAREFRRAGLETPELDARILVGHALGLDHAGLAAHGDARLADDEAHAIAALARRRLRREPVARILGRKEFWGLPLRLNDETLVPRPETETLVEAALAAVDSGGARARPLRVADLGTGSGALVLALVCELPAAFGVGTDVSVPALDCARENAAALGLAGRTAFVACDYGTALAGPFDLVVANPPYVPRDEVATLAPEVRDFDPRRALDGGRDGLDGYRAIAADARRLLAADGILVLEIGAGQSDAATRIVAAGGLRLSDPPRRDLAGVARALVARAPP